MIGKVEVPKPGSRRWGGPSLREEIGRRVTVRADLDAAQTQAKAEAARERRSQRLAAPPETGRRHRGAKGVGAAPIRRPMRLPAHTASTQALKTMYPWILDPGLGVRGAYVGSDVYSMASFEFDPWLLYAAGLISAPNIVVIGVIGSGKSALQKALILRLLAFGVRFSWIQVKPEYEALCQLVGISPMKCGPGQLIRFNPLAAVTQHSGQNDIEYRDQTRLRRIRQVSGMISIWRGRPLTSIERSVLTWALDAASGLDVPTMTGAGTVSLPSLLEAVIDTGRWADSARRVGVDPLEAAQDARDVRLVLGELVHGVLRGQFDSTEPGNPAFDLRAPGTLLDLSGVRDDQRLIALSMSCAKAAMAAELMQENIGQRLVGADEAWLGMRELEFLRAEQEEAKLARWFGISKMWAFHKFSDLAAVGADGSEQRALAHGLMSDTDVKISYRQDVTELGNTRAFMGTGQVQTELLQYLPRGVALWKIRDRVLVIKHHLSSIEAPLAYTDSRMRHVSGVDDISDDLWESLIDGAYAEDTGR